LKRTEGLFKEDVVDKETPQVVFGINKKNLGAFELLVQKDGKWVTISEDIYRIAEKKLRDSLYLFMFQGKDFE
jgi:hypothetical protein